MTITLSKPAILLIATLAALAAVLFFVGVIQGGDLEPPNGPDMGTTQIPPTWHQTLPADDGPTADGCNSSRFRCVLPTAAMPTGEAALDNTTGLVWERSPAVSNADDGGFGAIEFACYGRKTGGVLGWRPPKIEELHSLVDLEASTDPKLPPGHPFLGITADSDFWSTTPDFGNQNQAFAEKFDGTNVAIPKFDFIFFLCVRGANGHVIGH